MLSRSIDIVLAQPRRIKQVIGLAFDTLFIICAYWSAFYLKFDNLSLLYSAKHWAALAALLSISLLCFIKLGLYRAVLRFIDYHVFIAIAIGVILPTISMVMTAAFVHADLPIAIPIMYASWAMIFCGCSRLIMRSLYQQLKNKQTVKTKVFVYGAGEAGRQLASSINHGGQYTVVAFLDDMPSLQNTSIYGLPILSPKNLVSVQAKYQAKKLLIAIPSLSRSEIRRVINGLPLVPLEISIMPGVADLVSGKAIVSELKKIKFDDLLGRNLVDPFPELINYNTKNKVVLITGAGGSIGSELSKQVLQEKPNQLILFECSEYALYKIEQDLQALQNKIKTNIEVIAILGSVTDQSRIETVLSRFTVQTIYHAAAYKHVPLVEWNVIEGIKNNTFGTLTMAQAAISHQVETFVLISTDKAVRPTNVMGASKRLAEQVCQALASQQAKTTFCMVRFGNVLGSSGSVLPLMKKQIKNGGPVTVTHKDITRYFMAIREAAQLVIQAGAMAKGGDVFVLDMGRPVKIYELAKKMITSMGLTLKTEKNINGDIAIQVTQLRPGEKLYEELLINEKDKPTQHPRIRTTHEDYLDWPSLQAVLQKLKIAFVSYDQQFIRQILLDAKLFYQPKDGIHDLLWQTEQSSNQTAPTLVS